MIGPHDYSAEWKVRAARLMERYPHEPFTVEGGQVGWPGSGGRRRLPLQIYPATRAGGLSRMWAERALCPIHANSHA